MQKRVSGVAAPGAVRSLMALMTSALFFSSLAFAGTPNTHHTGAVAYDVGQSWLSSYFDDSESERWFSYKEEGGNSYCVEVVQGSFSPVILPSRIDIYSDAGGNSVLTADGKLLTTSNPDGAPSRVCYISPNDTGTFVRTVRVKATSNGDAGYLRMRVVNTTMLSSGWYAAFKKPHGYSRLDSNYTVMSSFAVVNYGAQAIKFRCFPTMTTPIPPALVTAGANLRVDSQAATVPAKGMGICPAIVTYNSYHQLPTSGDLTYSVSGYLSLAHDAPPGSITGSQWVPASQSYVPLFSIQ